MLTEMKKEQRDKSYLVSIDNTLIVKNFKPPKPIAEKY